MSERSNRWWVGSGGGSAGSAWHAGFLRRRAEDGVQYDGFAGVSAGAFAAASMAMSADLLEAARVFHDRALSVHTRDIHRKLRPFGAVQGLWDSAMRNSNPTARMLQELINDEDVRASGKALRIGVCALTQPPGEALDVDAGAPGAGAYFIVDETFSPLWLAVYCSGANPGVFRPKKIDGRWCVDGGVQVVTPVAAAVAAGATSIDVSIADTPWPQPMVESAKMTTVEVLLRSLELAIHRLTWVDLRYTQAVNALVQSGHPLADGKRVVRLTVSNPDSPLNNDSMRFDPEEALVIAQRGWVSASNLSGLESE